MRLSLESREHANIRDDSACIYECACLQNHRLNPCERGLLSALPVSRACANLALNFFDVDIAHVMTRANGRACVRVLTRANGRSRAA